MNDRSRTLIELAGFVTLAVVSKVIVDPLSWRFSGPVTLLFTLVVLTLYLRRRQLRWSSFGLIRLSSGRARWLLLPQTLLVIVTILGTGLVVGFAGEASGLAFMQPDAEAVNERWGELEGNLPLYLVWLTLGWVSSGFAEEMFFRGYLVSRLRGALDAVRGAPVLAVVIPALIFGHGHTYYQGLRGLVITGSIGIAMGTLFLLYRRNLWPLILAHGTVSTLSFTALFAGWDI